MKSRIASLLLAVVFLMGCEVSNENKETGPQLFQAVSASDSGVDFSNDLAETNQLNIKTYEYLYNGGGVAIGDINNDGLQDIYFTSTLLANKLYLNKGDFKFEDITESAGVAAAEGLKTGTVMVDVNNDGYLDIYVTRSGKNEPSLRENILYINNGDATFTNRAKDFGLASDHNTTHASFFDFDLDGDLDVYLLNHPIDFENCQNVRIEPNQNNELIRQIGPKQIYDTDQLLENKGNGTFEDITYESGVMNYAWGLSVQVADFSNDGLPDIYVANDYVEPDFYYINNGDGTFTESLANGGFQHISNNSMGSDVADFNNDGLLDMIVVDMIGENQKRQKSLLTTMTHDRHKTLVNVGYGDQQMRNVLQLNNGDGTFSEIGQLSGIAQTDWSWSPIFADFDNDGLKDLFVSNGYLRDLTNCDYTIYKSDSLVKANITDVHEYLSIIPSTPVRNYMYRNKGDLTFDDKSVSWGFNEKTFSNGAAYGDLDNDGDLDLVINNLNTTARLYRNHADSIYSNNFVRLQFEDNGANGRSVGTRVMAYAGGELQMGYVQSNRSYLSSSESTLHFGIGNNTQIDSLEIHWSDGSMSRLGSIDGNQTVVIKKDEQEFIDPLQSKIGGPMFAKLESEKVQVVFAHKENDFDDHLREPLLPHGFSTLGPALAIADINGDGLDDFYVGGAAGQNGAIYTQKSAGGFVESKGAWPKNQHVYEDVDAKFFDYDNDGDQDLYVSSGGSVYREGSGFYQDRLYQNNGTEGFSLVELPAMYTSSSHVTPLDFDNDGDIDLFVGGRVVPGQYPRIPRSYLLENTGSGFEDVTSSKGSILANVGLTTASKWINLDSDDALELMIVGEWMEVSAFEFEGGQFKKAAIGGLEKSNGWWNAIEEGDFDNDGDVDFIIGNLGLNSLYTTSVDEPFSIVAKDFDGNGSYDAIMNKYIDGVSWPVPQKNTMIKQVPKLQKNFVKYDKYSSSTIKDFFTKEDLEGAQKMEVYVFYSAILQNNGNGQFELVQLPVEAQLAPIFAINVDDFNNDGNLDALVGGNLRNTEVERGPYDGQFGVLLLGDGTGAFKVVKSNKSGFSSNKELRKIQSLEIDGNKYAITASSNEALEFYKINKP